MKPAAATEIGETSSAIKGKWRRRGFGILDFVLRILAFAAILAATIAMGTTDEQLPLFTQLFQFEAKYSDMPAFTFFVIANGIAGIYLLLSLPVSIFNIVRGHTAITKLVLVILDTIMVGVVTSAASAAAAIVYLANEGNSRANWFAICQQFGSFCQQSSGAVVVSLIGVLFLILLVTLSAFTLYRGQKRP
ncbi:hypothetical protein SUGI_1070780 [Cryptomeria japonica]|uniref:casparian strip membrane protein 2 n=1 Tax=Cryptomeria japonica TaxID=3369 RepID=UPI002414C390|nr:casparian strip membrane protein 2 [Cryptomeria japonica]GLJ50280.1 hypothetical protein SUGI_1070780 [Cryptomeria japonica]